MKSNKRIEYVDSAKAVAIILVIVGHCHWLGSIPKLGSLIYTFHMPLFFMVSGFFLKDLPIKDAFVKYAKAYLWPYLMIGFFILLIGILKCIALHDPWYNLIGFNLVKVLWGSNFESAILWGNIPHIGPSWFLLALFWGCMFFTILMRVKGRLVQICLLLIVVSFSLCSSKVLKMPLSVQGGMISVIYLYFGSYINKYKISNRFFNLPTYIKLLALLLWIVDAVFVPGFDIGSGSLGFSIVGVVVSLIGTFFVLGICKHFDLKFRWIGRNTLYILCAHILLWRILDVFGISSESLPFDSKINFIIEAFYEIIGALVLAWLLSKTKILELKRIKND